MREQGQSRLQPEKKEADLAQDWFHINCNLVSKMV